MDEAIAKQALGLTPIKLDIFERLQELHDEEILQSAPEKTKSAPLPEKSSPKRKQIELLSVPDDELDNVEPLFKLQRKAEPEIEVQQLALF